MRVVQVGSGVRRDFVVVYHLSAALDARVRSAFGQDAAIINVTEDPFKQRYGRVGVNGLRPIADLIDDFRRSHDACDIGRLVLVGYSEGCQAVRAQLRDGVSPSVIVVADGTHGSWPLTRADTEVWSVWWARAVAGECAFLASHSGLTYVEKLPSPYASTWTVLQRVSGWKLPLPRGTDTVRQQGSAIVWSNGDADKNAHVRQATEVLPTMLEQAAAWLAARAGGVEARAHGTQPAPSQTLGERCVAWSLAHEGLRENANGDHPLIAKWRDLCVRGYGSEARLLRLPPTNWCSIFACAALRECALAGEKLPHGFRAGVVEIVEDASGAHDEFCGIWRPVSMMSSGWRPAVGDLAIFDRSREGEPSTAWWRHVSRVVECDALAFRTIGGNENRTVRITMHKFDEPRLLGFVEYPRANPQPRGGFDPSETAAMSAMFLREFVDKLAQNKWTE